MTILRRILTVALGFPLLVLFLLGIVSCRISATLLSADFYKDRLSNSDFYGFALTDLPLTAVGEIRRSGDKSPDLDEILLMTAGLSDQEIVGSMNRVLPQDWLQDTLEQALDEIVPYIAGDRENFAIRAELNQNAETLVDEFKYLLRESDSYTFLSERIGEMAAEEVSAVSDKWELGVSNERIAQLVMNTVTAGWLQAEIERSLDNLAQHLLGETDDFDMPSEISEVARRASDEAKVLLQEAGAHDILYREVLNPTIADSLFESLGDQSTVDVLEKLRSALSGDLVWTEQNLLSLVESELGHEGLQGFQQARTWISHLQSLHWLAWIAVIVLLLSIGLLGSRNWPGRVSWAAAYLVGVTAILFVAFQVLSSTWNSRIEDARIESLGQIDPGSQFASSQELITDKGFEIVADMGHVLIDGMARQSLVGFVTGLVLLVGVVGWRYWRARTGTSG